MAGTANGKDLIFYYKIEHPESSIINYYLNAYFIGILTN